MRDDEDGHRGDEGVAQQPLLDAIDPMPGQTAGRDAAGAGWVRTLPHPDTPPR